MMRPIRFLFLLAFFVVLPVFLTFYSLSSKRSVPSESFRADYQTRSTFRALFSFTTPSSLFPPSAVISLTSDNSTFFLARPAAFGPSLPSKGLSGQLWIGRGFGEDVALKENDFHTLGWEFGCSDVPGWREDENKRLQKLALSAKPRRRSLDTEEEAEKHDDKPAEDIANKNGNDGTDDHLHHPLPDSNPATPGKLGESANVRTANKFKKPIHADIESLQESADIAGKIVMLARGGCGFLEKVKWAQRRGGIALIVGDDERGNPLTIMYAKGDTSNVTIPAIFTSYNAAHLLSSLVPSSLGLVDEGSSSSKSKTGSEASKASKKGATKDQDGPIFTSTTDLLPKSTNLPPKTSEDVRYDKSGWMQSALKVVGLKDQAALEHGEDSRRPPSSGNIDWVLVEDWQEEEQRKTSTKVRSQTKLGTTLTSSVTPKSTPTQKGAQDDFVIGVQDWRDTGLIAPKAVSTSSLGSAEKADGGKDKDGKPVKSEGKKQNEETIFEGGSITPGSGEYNRQNTDQDEHNKHDTSSHVQEAKSTYENKQRKGWFSFLRFGGCHSAKHETPDHINSTPHVSIPTSGNKDKGPNFDQREGLWVTLTPTSVSTSPFFDTLLVLVISPLITLSIVYAMLLLRSRIRRRRWRAPKSVIDRLPVRTYHTMSNLSSTTSSQVTSPINSSATSPLLQAASQDILHRPRPRSRTTTGVFPGSSVDSDRSLRLPSQSPPLEKLKSKPSKPKKYTGRQVECVVCLEEYVDGESKVMSLPCGHEFHADCITPWLVNRRRTCPICKGDVVRSLARSQRGQGTVDQTEEGEETSDDVQDRAAQTVNDAPSAAIPIPDHEVPESTDLTDIESGQGITEPLLGGSQSTPTADRQATAGWRNVLSRSLNRLSGDTVWRSTPTDRTR